MECKALRDSDREIRNYDVIYFMASADSPEDNRGFAEKNEASFPILSDPSKEMCNAYGVIASHGFPNRWTYYIDPDGVIQMIDKDVNPRNAGTDLVNNLQALGVPTLN
ncbi:MAG: redoxin domain-containing protein [Gammaproteobacteria bacterium]|nr:MAG: redoxin domain-containing protein [Gammaproteobacteria bacterium]TDJ36476.1 MAG: redoxin domain-containing protein [Gammaproteobacteria bacterium]